MPRIGDTLRPELGRTDYSAFTQGALVGGQAIGQGIEKLGQGAGKFLEDIGEAKKKVSGFEAFLKSAKKVVDPGSKHFQMLEELQTQVATAPLAQAAGIAAEGQKALQFLGDQMDRDLAKESVFFDRDYKNRALNQSADEFNKTFNRLSENDRLDYFQFRENKDEESRRWEADQKLKERATTVDEMRGDAYFKSVDAQTRAMEAPPLPDYKDLDAMRKEFNALKEVKDYKEVKTAYDKIKAAAQSATPAGDISLVFAYMKIVDPGSTVREGEFATAADAGSLPTKIVNIYNKILEGTRLSPEQRNDFLMRADELAKAQLEQAHLTANYYRGIADERGWDKTKVVPSYFGEVEEAPPEKLSDEELLKQLGGGVLPPKP